jgi:hypothetical protein
VPAADERNIHAFYIFLHVIAVGADFEFQGIFAYRTWNFIIQPWACFFQLFESGSCIECKLHPQRNSETRFARKEAFRQGAGFEQHKLTVRTFPSDVALNLPVPDTRDERHFNKIFSADTFCPDPRTCRTHAQVSHLDPGARCAI